MTLEQSPIIEGPHTDEFSMAICAIRYCIGRQSYIVSDGARWAREYGRRSPWVRSVIIRDLQEQVDRIDRLKAETGAWSATGLGLGMEMDEKLWRAVLADLKAMGAADVG